MLDALIEIDRICKIHKIDYWLDAGTLLGAVRHKGFIPWDDDIDICMTRADFNRFLKYAPSTMDSTKFFLQTHKSDSLFVNNNIPCKFRVNNTFILENHEQEFDCFEEKSHHGLFVDIFPYDKYSSNNMMRRIERILSIGYRLHVLTKYKNLPPFKYWASRLTKPFTKISFLEWWKYKQIAHMETKKAKYLWGAGCETPFSRAYFINKEIFPTKQIKFEGYTFNAPNQPEVYLKKMFGNNYMTLPPIEEQKSHGIIFNDQTEL